MCGKILHFLRISLEPLDQMDELSIIIMFFGGIFTFAFGLAWFIPLVTACQKESEPTYGDTIFSLLDLLLLLLDCIPLFWIFRDIPQAPSTYRLARETWRNQPTIRTMFWYSSISLVITLVAAFLPG
jgi:ABC-type antimicrobial peptide transport system permease subunit